MDERAWRPLLRTPASTLTRVLRSAAFLHARERAATTVASAVDLRTLAALVETVPHHEAPLATIADRLGGAVRFLRATADRLEATPTAPAAEPGLAARQRLVVAGLHYLVTPDDLVPDFRAGGYVDDVVLLAWVFGTAADELAAHGPGDDPGHGGPPPGVRLPDPGTASS